MERLLYRFLTHHPDGLSDQELLELLLRFTRQDAKEFAERLLEQYPTIYTLMEADRDALSVLDGIDEKTILLLRLMPEMTRRYFISRNIRTEPLLSGTQFGRYLMPYFMSARDELVYALFLDGSANPINCRLMGHGSVNSANVPIRRIVHEALTVNATGIVLSHNHPSGIAVPSREDVEITRRLRDSLEIMDLHLMDHIIVADDDFVSLKDNHSRGI